MKTKVVNVKYSEYDVYIGRPSKWGNPWPITRRLSRRGVCCMYKRWLDGEIESPDGRKPPTKEEIIKELKGKKLGCHCYPCQCHGDILVAICEDSENGK